MIEIRLRAAASNPASRPWRRGISLAALALGVVAPVATSRAQDAAPALRSATQELADVRALKVVTIDGGKAVAIDGGESISITSGAASITMKKDGTIVIKGTDVVIDRANEVTTTAANGAPPCTQTRRGSRMSEIF